MIARPSSAANWGRKSQVSLVTDMTKHVDGVVDMTVSMTYRHDDTHDQLPGPWVRSLIRISGW